MQRFTCASFLLFIWLCSTGVSMGADSPSESYRKYLAALNSARSTTDISPYLSSSMLKSLESLPAPEKERMLASMKAQAPAGVMIVSENIQGEIATLIVEGTKPGSRPVIMGKGSVQLRLEGGRWKIERQNYKY